MNISYHHGHRTKKGLEIIRKLSTSSITRIHGNKAPVIGIEPYFLAWGYASSRIVPKRWAKSKPITLLTHTARRRNKTQRSNGNDLPKNSNFSAPILSALHMVIICWAITESTCKFENGSWSMLQAAQGLHGQDFRSGASWPYRTI